MYHLFFLSIFLLSPPTLSSYVKTGTITSTGHFSTPDGNSFAYTSRAKVTQPVIMWKDLSDAGIRMTHCAAGRGNIIAFVNVPASRRNDFPSNAVLTFDREAYESHNCGATPQTTELYRVDDIIFRKIIKSYVYYRSGSFIAICQTEFVPGVDVCPEVDADIIPVFSKTLYQRAELKSTSGEAAGSVVLVTNATISAGISQFRFFRRNLTASWVQSLGVTAGAKITVSGSLTKETDKDKMKKVAIGPGFNRKIPMIGRVTAGLFAVFGYEASISVSKEINMEWVMGFNTAQMISVGRNKFSKSSLDTSDSPGGATIGLSDDSSTTTTFAVEGFVGVKAGLLLEINMPWLEEAKADLTVAATVGASANLAYQTPPFPAVSSGSTLNDACNDCHSIEGSINLKANALKIEAHIPGMAKDIDQVLLDTIGILPLGRACLLQATCSDELPACPCRCTSWPNAYFACKELSHCTRSRCSYGGRWQCC